MGTDVSASIPREVGWERENQRGHWVDSCDAKDPPLPCGIVPKYEPPSDGLASIPLTWVTVSTESLSLGSGPLGHGPVSGTNIFPVPKGEVGAHAFLGCVTGSLPGNWCVTPPPYCPSRRWHESVPGTEESEREPDELRSFPGCLCVRQGTCPSRHHKPACPWRPPPHPEREASVMIIWRQQTTPIFTPFWRKSGSPTLRGYGDRPLKLLVGGETA